MWPNNINVSGDEISIFQVGAALRGSISAQSHYSRIFPWEIRKEATPNSLNILPGERETVQYTITATKGDSVENGFIDGQICVMNYGAVATQNLAITVELTMPPSSTVIASVPVDISPKPTIVPGDTFCYNYAIHIPPGSVIPNKVYEVTARITITNHVGHFGIPFGPSPSDTDPLQISPIRINDTIHVDDTNGMSFVFANDGCQSYDRLFSCEDEGRNINTATIRETGQQSSVEVIVACGSSSMISETVCVQADITIIPNVAIGAIETFCIGEPVIGPCSGNLAEECTFTVSQNICVQIPLTFSVEANAIPRGIVCNTI